MIYKMFKYLFIIVAIMTNSNVYVAIMAGGIGSRFWPASRTAKPKQFLDILDTGNTLLQQTISRFDNICPPENILILTNKDYTALIKEQLPNIKEENILAEPARKNTAPCIAYAVQKIKAKCKDAVMIVVPSDHIILKEEEYVKVLQSAINFCSSHDALITLGIKPTRPDTGYGYIQYYDRDGNNNVHRVKTFTEKPNKATALQFIESGDFLWNAGMFIWSIDSIHAALERYMPDLYEAFEETIPFLYTKDENNVIERAFKLCPNISIDFGIMEKAKNVFVIPADLGWSDLGTWASLFAEKEKDYLHNAVNGNKVMMYDAHMNMIHVPNNKLVVIQGLENYIVVDTDDVLLICNKEHEQQIKDITHDIKMNKGDKYL
jgi:mannose-1-phosphate guanylyltransferase